MHQNPADARNRGRLRRAQHRIPQKARADSVPLACAIDREAGQDHYRNRVGHIAAKSAGCFGVRHCADCETVITYYSGAVAYYVGSGCTTVFVGERSLPQPVVERRHTRIERGEIVLEREFNRRAEPWAFR